MSRIRGDLLAALHQSWDTQQGSGELMSTVRALNLLLDLDLAP
ncbi:MAG: hypothetical protein U0794_20420 [Isosphaeraceae bacterium]